MTTDRRGYRILKRALDVLVAAALLVLTAPVMLAVALSIAAVMGRPVLFRQTRTGLHGRRFTIVKFRSMRLTGAGLGPEYDEVRLSRLGRWLRATSLDELPNLVNVLRGEMSLIGPRPLPLEILDIYTAEQFRRHEVRPGVTGLAQVNGRNGLTWDEKFAYDVWYVDNLTLRLDLRILFRTAIAVLRRDGIVAPGRGARLVGAAHHRTRP